MRFALPVLVVLGFAALVALPTWPLSRKLGAGNPDYKHNVVAAFAWIVAALFLGLLFEPSSADWAAMSIFSGIAGVPIFAIVLRLRWWKAIVLTSVPVLLMTALELSERYANA